MAEYHSAELSATAGGDAAAIADTVEELALAAARLEPLDAEQLPHVWTQTIRTADGWDTQIHNLDEYAERPRRKTGTVTLATTESLADYVNRHATEGTTLYANVADFSVHAILDDHDKAGPRHRDHHARLTLQKTPGALRWLNAHTKYLDQEAFAQLIEDGLTEIARPSGADLLEVAQSIRATKSATFRSDKRLQSGRVQFQWVEELDARAGADGDLEIPETVTLVFAPFYGAPDLQIDARFRYRLNAGKLTLGFWLIRHEELLRHAFEAELARLHGLLDVDTLQVWGAS